MTRNRENHLMPAEKANPDLIRIVLSGLPAAQAIVTPPGLVAITRRDVMNAGLDTLAVARWLLPLGGYGAVAYLRPSSHKHATDSRPALHPISYFAVPVAALQKQAAAKDSETEADSAAA